MEFLLDGLNWFLSNLIWINILFGILLVFFERRNPTTTWLWLMVFMFLPGIGFIFYLFLGQDLSKKKLFESKDEEDICFIDYVEKNDLPALYSMADIFVFTTLYEGFGIPLVEAMRCGTPIIAGNLTSLPEIVGDAGILVNPFDTAEIATQMQRLFVDEQLRKDLSEKGLQRAPLFNWDFTAKAVWSVIEEVGKEL